MPVDDVPVADVPVAEAGAASPCRSCGAAVEPDDQFCEGCGASLTGAAAPQRPAGSRAGSTISARPRSGSIPTAPVPAPRHAPCVGCGAPAQAIGSDGYCTECGLRQPGPRDHLEVDLGTAAGVTDRGRHHPRNEDALHLEQTETGAVVAVVCDGVSSSQHAEVASQAAIDAAAAVFSGAGPDRGQLVASTVAAMDAAQRAVAAIPWTDGGQLGSPSCTFVSALCHRGVVAIGWVGDSRAYWIGAEGIRQLTVDNSWAEAQVTAGRMTELEADGDPRSHAITRWLGIDAPDGEAQVITLEPEGAGRLLVCSDGLWNYAPTQSQMAEVLASNGPGVPPIDLARSLTAFALGAGGHDNITVVIVDLAFDAAPADPGRQKGPA